MINNPIARTLLSCVLIASIITTTAAARDVVLISPQAPPPVVVHADTVTERNAAADFCDYLSRVTGQQIKPGAEAGDAAVVFHVGRDAFVREHAPELDDLYADGFVIKGVEVDGRYHVILSGRIEQASQWAIEQFLADYCGVRWLLPDPKYGEIVPSRPTITVAHDLSRVIEPDYLARANMGMYIFNPARTLLRRGPVGYEYGEHAIQFIFNNGAHSGELFEQHPEWFAYFNGKRQWWAYGNGWQICTSNPETAQHVIKHLLALFEKNPDALMASVGANDGSGHCECPDCLAYLASATPAYTRSEQWWHWVNQVAAEVGKHHPDKWIEALAYSWTSPPPRFALEPNVAITKTFVLDSEFEQARQWAEVCKSVNLYSYMYGNSFLGFRHYPRAARDFLKWGYDELGARGHVSESGGEWTFDAPKYHYMQALQWDVNADLDAVMDDFCRHSYGAAAAPMRAFWDRLEEIYERRRATPYGETNRRMLFYQWTGWVMSSYVQPNDEFQEYTADDVAFLEARIGDALRLAADDGEAVQFRMERMNEAWRFYRTALISYTRLYDLKEQAIASQADFDQAFTLAQEIADLRAERDKMLGAMRLHPHINHRTAGRGYWSWNAALTIFNHELTLLDGLSDALTRHLLKVKDADAARAFWGRFQPTDSLFEAARTQLYFLSGGERVDVLVNGDFQTGDLTGWEVKGAVAVVPAEGRPGRFVASMSGGGAASLWQRFTVTPNERYRLSALARYPSPPPATAVALESIIEFYAGEQRIGDHEPTRATLRTTSPEAGWVRLQSTVTVPPGATHGAVNLERTYSGDAQWADVRMERLNAGVEVASGELSDSFDGQHLDHTTWFQSTYTGGFRPPNVHDGQLVYDSTEMYPLTSYRTFNQLHEHRGDDRYRLRFHVARTPSSTTPASFTFALQSNSGSIRTRVSGHYWSHSFGDSGKAAQFYGHASQGVERTYGAVHDIKHLSGDAQEVWYTLAFDPEFVTVYAAADGYDASEASQVARYAHGITDLKSTGDVHLKLEGRAIRLQEISLTGPARPGRDEAGAAPDAIRTDEHQLFMPGVTD